jgi:acyl-CoA thioester hydrolase
MGIVYHANYFKWFEIGRTELFRDIGIVYADLEKEGYFLPLTESYCHYLSPARYDDVIIIETELAFMRYASIRFDYRIWSETKERLLVEGYTLHAFLNGEGKIVRAPKDLVDRVNSNT